MVQGYSDGLNSISNNTTLTLKKVTGNRNYIYIPESSKIFFYSVNGKTGHAYVNSSASGYDTDYFIGFGFLINFNDFFIDVMCCSSNGRSDMFIKKLGPNSYYNDVMGYYQWQIYYNALDNFYAYLYIDTYYYVL